MLDDQDHATPVKTARHVDLGISSELDRAARMVVFNKHLLDSAVADHGASMLARELHDGGYGPCEPMPFLNRIIPFAYTIERTSGYTLAMVPTANTIGCSWKWWRKDLSDEEALKCRRSLNDSTALENGTLNEASYAWIKPLGLFAPGEGKNRVDFFREERIATIPAKVYERTYPDANRIVLYRVKQSAFSATWAVLDGRWVENVGHPSWTLPLMTAYGVKTEEGWPHHFPRPADVVLALFDSKRVNSPLGNPDFDHASVVDLETIRAIEAYQNEPQQVTVHDLKNVNIDHRVWKLSLAGTLASIALLICLPNSWADARTITGIMLGVSACAGLLPFTLPVITAPRHGLAKEEYLPREKSPKDSQQPRRRHLG